MTAFTAPYLEEIKQVLKMDYLEIPYVTYCLEMINKNLRTISIEAGIDDEWTFGDRACEIAEVTIRRQLAHYIVDLEGQVLAKLVTISATGEGYQDLLSLILRSFLSTKSFIKF
jgi:hypothetical protein